MPERQDGDNPDQEERDGDGEERREGAAPPMPGTTDGDAASPAEPRGLQDGIIVVGEPTAARDGIADMSREAREPEDLAAFTSPSAGRYNPYLYSIELDPLRDRRTRELFYYRSLLCARRPRRRLRGVPRGADRHHGDQQHLPQQRATRRSRAGGCGQRARRIGLAQARRRAARQRARHLLRPVPHRGRPFLRVRGARPASTSRGAPTSSCWPCTRSTRTCAACSTLLSVRPSAATWRLTVSPSPSTTGSTGSPCSCGARLPTSSSRP